MKDYEFFSSYELTHEKGRKSGPSKGGCGLGCLTFTIINITFIIILSCIIIRVFI